MGLLCKQPLPANIPAEVFMTTDNQTYSATVHITHSTPVGDGFRIGCEYVVREEE